MLVCVWCTALETENAGGDERIDKANDFETLESIPCLKNEIEKIRQKSSSDSEGNDFLSINLEIYLPPKMN